MTKDTKPNEELSVEEILSSIRSVINGHTSKVKNTNKDEDILELTETYNPSDEKEDKLLSIKAAKESSDALKDFANKASKIDFSNNKNKSANALEELVINIIKPEISSWLNNNLPTIVREIVEKEIKRLTPKDD